MKLGEVIRWYAENIEYAEERYLEGKEILQAELRKNRTRGSPLEKPDIRKETHKKCNLCRKTSRAGGVYKPGD